MKTNLIRIMNELMTVNVSGKSYGLMASEVIPVFQSSYQWNFLRITLELKMNGNVSSSQDQKNCQSLGESLPTNKRNITNHAHDDNTVLDDDDDDDQVSVMGEQSYHCDALLEQSGGSWGHEITTAEAMRA